MKLVIEQYGRPDDTIEEFLGRVEAAGYNRAHAFAYIQWGLICFFLGRGFPSLLDVDIVIEPSPTKEEHDFLRKYLEEKYGSL